MIWRISQDHWENAKVEYLAYILLTAQCHWKWFSGWIVSCYVTKETRSFSLSLSLFNSISLYTPKQATNRRTWPAFLEGFKWESGSRCSRAPYKAKKKNRTERNCARLGQLSRCYAACTRLLELGSPATAVCSHSNTMTAEYKRRKKQITTTTKEGNEPVNTGRVDLCDSLS